MGRCDPVKKYYFLTKGVAVCCAHNLSAGGAQIPHLQPERFFGQAETARTGLRAGGGDCNYAAVGMLGCSGALGCTGVLGCSGVLGWSGAAGSSSSAKVSCVS